VVMLVVYVNKRASLGRSVPGYGLCRKSGVDEQFHMCGERLGSDGGPKGGALSYARGTPVRAGRAAYASAHLHQQPKIGISLTSYQRQHRIFHIQKDVLPYALC